jgi:hypothetical protein
MNTPNEIPQNTAPDADSIGTAQPGKGKRHDRTQRAAFWLRTIELQKERRTREFRRSLRDVARDGISDEEYAAMLGTLEKMARNLGWDESQLDERPFGRGHRPGFGPGADSGFGGERGFGRGHRHPAMLRGFGRPDRDHHDHSDHKGRKPGREDVTADAPQA